MDSSPSPLQKKGKRGDIKWRKEEAGHSDKSKAYRKKRKHPRHPIGQGERRLSALQRGEEKDFFQSGENPNCPRGKDRRVAAAAHEPHRKRERNALSEEIVLPHGMTLVEGCRS